jgi:hypothetical protein
MKITVVPAGPRAGIYFESEAHLREFIRNPKVETVRERGFTEELRTANGLPLRVGNPIPSLPVHRVLELERD